MRRRSSLGLLALLPLLLVAPPTAAHGDSGPPTARPVTCHGEVATIVSSNKRVVEGTDGDDVIVARDAGPVYAGAGDDRICLVGVSKRRHEARGESGDDRIYVDSPHLQTFVILGGDVDYFRGGSGPDVVFADDHTPDALEHNVVRTGGGRDEVTVRGGNGRAGDDIRLGPGADSVDVGTAGIARRIFGGPGRDEISLAGGGDLTIDNRSERATSPDGVVAAWSSMEAFGAGGRLTFLGSGADESLMAGGSTVTARMGAGADRVLAVTCTADLRGGDGDDELRFDAFLEGHGCEQTADLAGGADDDVLLGGPGPDVLDGGDGIDSADGRGGTDTCTAETVTSCEGPPRPTGSR